MLGLQQFLPIINLITAINEILSIIRHSPSASCFLVNFDFALPQTANFD